MTDPCPDCGYALPDHAPGCAYDVPVAPLADVIPLRPGPTHRQRLGMLRDAHARWLLRSWDGIGDDTAEALDG